MDFIADQLFDGRAFRILTVVDCHTRESLAIVPRVSFRAYQVVETLDEIAWSRDRPKSLRVDNGPEFAGRVLDQWAYLNRVEDRLLPARNARGQRLHRGVQQPLAGGMPECVMVLVHG